MGEITDYWVAMSIDSWKIWNEDLKIVIETAPPG